MSGEPSLLTAELWYPAAPELDGERLVGALHEKLPATELVGGEQLLLAHQDVQHTYADGKRGPLMTAVAVPEGRMDPPPDLSQTYDFPAAAETLAACTANVAVIELMGRVHPHGVRGDVFATVLEAVAALWPPAAIWCPHIERVLHPDALRTDPLAALLNVRMFSIANDPGTVVMDTLGLGVLGLPDLQCHFRDLDPGAVAGHLRGLAGYLFENGDVIDSGHTVGGLRPDSAWTAQHEDALIAPDRLVLDLDPGAPWAAGERQPE